MNIGALIGGSFGLVYVLVNAGALGAPAGPVLQVAGVLVFVALLAGVLPGVFMLGGLLWGATRPATVTA